MPKSLSVPGRWWEKVATSDECWLWTASRDKDGYGKFQYPTDSGQVSVRAHRWAYEHFYGPIPEGAVVMHTCDNPPCVNPAHLRVGTPRDNNDDKVAKGRHARLWGIPLNRSQQTHCKQGHELSGDNLWVNPKTGHRRCKECNRMAQRKRYRRLNGLPGDGEPRRRKGGELGGEVST